MKFTKEEVQRLIAALHADPYTADWDDALSLLRAKRDEKDAAPVALLDGNGENIYFPSDAMFHYWLGRNCTKLYDRPAHNDIPEAVQLLSDVFHAWENGTQCNEEDGNYIGTAFHLDDAVFHRCCDLLNRVNPPRNAHQHDDTALLRMALGQLGCNTENMSKGMSKSIQKLCARENTEAITALRERLGEKA